MPTFNEEYELNDLISNLLLNIEIKIKYKQNIDELDISLFYFYESIINNNINISDTIINKYKSIYNYLHKNKNITYS